MDKEIDSLISAYEQKSLNEFLYNGVRYSDYCNTLWLEFEAQKEKEKLEKVRIIVIMTLSKYEEKQLP